MTDILDAGEVEEECNYRGVNPKDPGERVALNVCRGFVRIF